MQGHRRLAGARPALDQEDPGQGGPDDLVLLALDGAHDVGHVAGPRLPERGQQRPRAAQGQAPVEERLGGAGVGMARSGGAGLGEVLVLDADHRAAPDGQVPAAGQPLGVEAGGPVEGLGDRGAPVDHQRLVVLPRHRQPADVERLEPPVPLGPPVDPAEAQRLVADVELGQAGQAGPDHDVALGAGLEGAAPPEVQDRLEHPVRLAAHGLEAAVRVVEDPLFFGDVSVCGHVSPFLRRRDGRTSDSRARPGGGGRSPPVDGRRPWGLR